MVAAPPINEAFRRLQAGDAAGALECARRVAAGDPANARARLAAGIALRMAGRYGEAFAELSQAQALDPRDHAAVYEAGMVRQLEGRAEEALAHYERCARMRPDFFAAPFCAGLLRAERGDWAGAVDAFRAVLAVQPGQADALLNLAVALDRGARRAEAEEAFVHALAANPDHAPTVRIFGQYSAAHGNFRRAASLFAEAARLEPGDDALPMFAAQCELLLGRWEAAWAPYARRPSRREFERARAARGTPYALPPPDALPGREITLVGEQGLGDTLFFLRWAPTLKRAGARISFAGDPRLHSLLGRTGLFEALGAPPAGAEAPAPVLVGDLPALFNGVDPLSVASLGIAPLPARVASWEAALQSAGPRPWIGVQWRAGTPHQVVAHALAKTVPMPALLRSLAPSAGTLAVLQRGLQPGELEAATQAAARPVADLSHANADLEDVLALCALLDRHVAVSSTTMHLAAAAGASADVLVPFPPEWRWRLEGDSPWFPGLHVHRQRPDGDWGEALATLAASMGRGR